MPERDRTVVLSERPVGPGFPDRDRPGIDREPGIPPQRLDVPFTDDPVADGATIFRDPMDPTVRYFVPVYRVAERQVGGAARYEIALRPDGAVWQFSVVLSAGRPDTAPPETRPIAHDVAVRLVYDRKVDGGGTLSESLDLTVRRTDEGLVASREIGTLAGRDAVFHALTRPEAHPRLVVSRVVRAAVRQVSPPPPRAVIDLLELSPRARWNGARLTDPSGNSTDGADLPFNGGEGDARGFVILSDTMPMEDGTRRRALRTHPKWVPNGTIKGWHPDVPLPAGAVFEADVGFVNGAVHTDGVQFIVFEHHFVGTRRTWNEVLRYNKRYTGALDHVRVDLSALAGREVGIELRVDAGPSSAQDWAAWIGPRIVGANPGPPPPRYIVGAFDLAQDNVFPVPFFDPDLHPYIFTGIGGVGTPPPLLTRHTVVYRGVPYDYYEQADVPGQFLYLPDAFKLGRRTTAPFTPALLVTFSTPDGRTETLTAALSYVLYPVVDTERLAAAAPALRAAVPLLPPDVEVRFDHVRVRADQLSLRLALPRPGGGVVREERPGVVSALDREITDTVVLDMKPFQAVFNAMMGSGAAGLFSGEVLVSVQPQENFVVPVVARLADLTGRVFEETQQRLGPGRVQVTLRNRAESPARVPSLTCRLTGAGSGMPVDMAAEVTGFRVGDADAVLPAVVPPNGVLSFVASAQTAAPDLVAVYDLGGVTVEPDRERVLDAIVDQAVPPPLHRTLAVTIFRDIFDRNADLRRLVVEFSTEATLEFGRADFPTGVTESSKTIDLAVRLRDLLSETGGGTDYRYRVRAIGALGEIGATEWYPVEFPLFPKLTSIPA
ncbi:hypothetical protein [Virgisporangium aurantiacum]|uniref:Uncharacterized protein n=1 Tax=Virgisporangium aurantiacum TaxID=175570 RepID=A0A8J3Z4C8_9ACTN|nr:hypothetical protein [Virgisporangium aurantiacum]GIJ57316.1 hypothetical protein Vau01_048320 [Virgisporangium aurantiacum]